MFVFSFFIFFFLIEFLAQCFLFPEDTVDPQILVELFSIYREWQDTKAQDITTRQVRLKNLCASFFSQFGL